MTAAQGAGLSGEEVAQALRWPECHEEVSRRGEAEPCDKPAAALRMDPQGGEPYPVCGHHSRAVMVPLAEIVAHFTRRERTAVAAALTTAAEAIEAVKGVGTDGALLSKHRAALIVRDLIPQEES